MKINPYKHKERYLNWKENTKDRIPSVIKANSNVIKRYLHDREYGVNIASSNIRGGRSYIRSNTLRDKMIHHYFGVDLNIVWNIIKIDLPNLKDKILKIKKELK